MREEYKKRWDVYFDVQGQKVEDMQEDMKVKGEKIKVMQEARELKIMATDMAHMILERQVYFA